MSQWGYDYVFTRAFSCNQKESSKNTTTLQQLSQEHDFQRKGGKKIEQSSQEVYDFLVQFPENECVQKQHCLEK